MRATGSTWFLRFLNVFCFLLPLIAVVMLFTGNVRDDIDLVHGPRVMGTIVDSYINYDSHNNKSYRLIVEFPANGRTVRERVHVEADEYEQNPIGSTTLVTYARRDPSVVRLGAMTPARADRDIAVQAAMSAVITAFMLLMFCSLEYFIRVSMTLLRIGRPATATIERTEPGSRGRVVIIYTFEAQGTRWTGRANYTATLKVASTPGTTIPILYLPGKPKRNAPVAYVLKMARLRSRSSFDRS